MRTLTKFAAASAAALSLAAIAAPASASVFISFDGTNTVAGGSFADGVYTYLANCGAVNCGGFAAIQVSGDTGALPTLLHSQNVDATTVAGGAADITIWVTRNDISSPSFGKFKSSFTSNSASDNDDVTPFTVTMETFISTSNALFGGAMLSGFTTDQSGALSSNQISFGTTGGGLYSVTEKYTIHADAFHQTESTSPSIIFAAVGGGVPEPATWGLMLVGFGGAGAMLRRRRAVAATA